MSRAPGGPPNVVMTTYTLAEKTFSGFLSRAGTQAQLMMKCRE